MAVEKFRTFEAASLALARRRGSGDDAQLASRVAKCKAPLEQSIAFPRGGSFSLGPNNSRRTEASTMPRASRPLNGFLPRKMPGMFRTQ